MTQSDSNRRYRAKNSETVKELVRNWRKRNPDKVKEYNRRAYFLKKAGERADKFEDSLILP